VGVEVEDGGGEDPDPMGAAQGARDPFRFGEVDVPCIPWPSMARSEPQYPVHALFISS